MMIYYHSYHLNDLLEMETFLIFKLRILRADDTRRGFVNRNAKGNAKQITSAQFVEDLEVVQ